MGKKAKGSRTKRTTKTTASSVKKLSQVKKLALVQPGLFVGNKDAARDGDLLRRVGITHIVNVGGGSNHFPSEFEYLKFGRIKDASESNILQLMVPSCIFIDVALGRAGQPSHSRGEAGPVQPGSAGEPIQDHEVGSQPTTAAHGQPQRAPSRRHAPQDSVALSAIASTRGGVRAGAVLVHCKGGISRSVTIVCAYLLWSGAAATVEEALSIVRAARPPANPKSGFLLQLHEFSRKLVARRHGQKAEHCQHQWESPSSGLPPRGNASSAPRISETNTSLAGPTSL
eukprot:INCI3432.1.p1 GENE.INCI3432.1~~INCI3432.1.p1  ORF type:complete len:285 (+),score=32.15 INCI3432.1:335-1189(+)